MRNKHSRNFAKDFVSMAVPTLDLSKFLSGTPEERKQFALDLLDSFERTGFAKLKNHTFSNDQLRELFHWVSHRL